MNNVLDHIAEMLGAPAEVEGVLNGAFAGQLDIHEYWLLHYPKTERRSDSGSGQTAKRSRLLLEFGDGSIRPNPATLARWEGKRVRVHGIVRPAKVPMALSDPSSAYRSYLEVYSLQRVTSEQRREDA